jgi:hypothetical protein
MSALSKPWSGLDHYPVDWPSQEFYVNQGAVTEAQLEGLRKLVESRASETQVEQFLRTNREALALALGLFQTGHHASWIVPKQTIRTRLGSHEPGLIPDYLVAGANSNGVTWWVLELKGCDAKVFSPASSSPCLSPEANRGVIQVLKYIDVCAEIQSHLRDQLGLVGLREPRGILLIGADDEYSETHRRKLKAAWNRYMPQVQIRSFHALFRETQKLIESRHRSS